jgi:hypothetical protein
MKEEIIKLVQEYTRHKHVKITNRGNTAIFSAMYIAKKMNPKPYILIPDQGGWTTYKTYPEMLGMEIKEIKTEQGIINLEDLKRKAKSGSALIVSSFAGYFAEQPLREISEICHENKCILIEDASGSIGDEELCNGRYSDMIIGSFGKWKPVNVGYGGFISTNHIEYFEKAEVPFSLIRIYPDSYPDILSKLHDAKKRLELFMETCQKIKKDLARYEIVHRDKRCINVMVKYDGEKEMQELINYCENNNFEYIKCPKYERLNEEAISIEVKRM